MKVILTDKTKFLELGSVEKFDLTVKIEQAYHLKLRKWFAKGFLSKEFYELVRPTRSQYTKVYRLPESHKEVCPTRSILDMINAPDYKIAKYVISVLHPNSKNNLVIV